VLAREERREAFIPSGKLRDLLYRKGVAFRRPLAGKNSFGMKSSPAREKYGFPQFMWIPGNYGVPAPVAASGERERAKWPELS